MNHKGQTLILFVLLLPILLILLALIIDIGLMSIETTKLNGITNQILKDTKEKKLEEIEKIYQKNKIPIDKLEVNQDSNYLEIQNEYEINSIFGKIIGIQKYKITVHKKIEKNREDSYD